MQASTTRTRPRWRMLVVAGLVAMLAGAVDPLEGSLVILPGVGLVAFSAWRGRSRHRTLLLRSLALVATGVGAMFVLSALGGVGGTSGRSAWWALVILPYPLGWILGMVGTLRLLREVFGSSGLSPIP